MNPLEKFPPTIAWLISAVGAFVMSAPTAVLWLCVFMALDSTTGLIAAAMTSGVNSKRAWIGIGRKALTLAMVGASHWATDAMHLGYDLGALVAIAYTVGEFISITENCHRAGVWVPGIVLKALEKARDLANWDGPERRVESREFNGPEQRKGRREVRS